MDLKFSEMGSHLNSRGILFYTLLIFFSFIEGYMADESGESQISSSLNSSTSTKVIVISVIFIVFLLIFLAVLYIKYCHESEGDYVNEDASPDRIHRHSNGLLQFRGEIHQQNSRLAASLPFFSFYAMKRTREEQECAVCLTRFEDDDILRLLPKCNHVFHVTCVDRWINITANCPICRCRIEIENPTHTRQVVESANHSNTSVDQEEIGRCIPSISITIGTTDRKEDEEQDLYLNPSVPNIASPNERSTMNPGSDLTNRTSWNTEVMKIKTQMKKEGVKQTSFIKVESNNVDSTSVFPSCSSSSSFTMDDDSTTHSRFILLSTKRSMSEILHIPKISSYNMVNVVKEFHDSVGSSPKEERIHKLGWNPQHPEEKESKPESPSPKSNSISSV